MNRTIKMILEYMGTGYRGWQRQDNGPSIQGEIERALATLLKEKVAVMGAGRTDAGVHAFKQVAAFKSSSDMELLRMRWSLNALLPGDIVVKRLEEVPSGFDPRRDALWREYHYYLLNRPYPSAFFSGLTLHISKPLDVEAMDLSAKYLVGEHDFAAFCAADVEGSTVRRVLEAEVIRDGKIVWAGEPLEGLVTVRIRAHAFLYNMMRIVTGTLLDVGRGKSTPSGFDDVLGAGDRTRAGKTLSPRGLTLVEVAYPNRLLDT